VHLGRFIALPTAGVLLFTGCLVADSNSGPVEPAGITIRLVIADGNIREPDVSCEGAGAYRFAHPEAPFVIADATGRAVATGTLPLGAAEPAWGVDLGDRRQPTVCVMLIGVPGLHSVDGLSLVIDGGHPKPITLNPNLGDAPEVLLS
jgi:hypothetical protein